MKLNVRLISSNEAYVAGHEMLTGNLPLSVDDVEIETLMLEPDYPILIKHPVQVEYKDGTIIGDLMSFNDKTVTIQQGLNKIILSDYRSIVQSRHISCHDDKQIVVASYVTRNLDSVITNNLYLGDSNHNEAYLSSLVDITNNTKVNYQEAQVELVVAQPLRKYHPMMAYTAVYRSDTTSQTASTPSGIIITLNRLHDLMSGYRTRLNIDNANIKVENLYVIDTDQQRHSYRNNALHVIRLTPAYDVLAGRLNVYDNQQRLLSSSYNDMIGSGQVTDLELVSVPDIYAEGSYSQTDHKGAASDISLTGIIYNHRSTSSHMILRYDIGDKAIVTKNENIVKEGSYAIINYIIPAQSQMPYHIMFQIQ